MFDVWCLAFDIWCRYLCSMSFDVELMFDAWFLVFDVLDIEFDVWWSTPTIVWRYMLTFDVWCVWRLTSDVWCLNFGVWTLRFDVWLTFDVWCLTFEVWCLNFNVRCSMLCVWHLMLGIYCLAVLRVLHGWRLLSYDPRFGCSPSTRWTERWLTCCRTAPKNLARWQKKYRRRRLLLKVRAIQYTWYGLLSFECTVIWRYHDLKVPPLRHFESTAIKRYRHVKVPPLRHFESTAIKRYRH